MKEDELMSICPECDAPTDEMWDKTLQEYVRVCTACEIVGLTAEQIEKKRAMTKNETTITYDNSIARPTHPALVYTPPPMALQFIVTPNGEARYYNQLVLKTHDELVDELVKWAVDDFVSKGFEVPEYLHKALSTITDLIKEKHRRGRYE